MAGPIAEAFVRLRPDLSVFRTELQAGVTAAVESVRVPPITVPITTVAVGDGGATSAQAGAAARQELVASQRSATEGTRTLTVATNELTAARQAGTEAAAQFAAIERTAALSTSEVTVARRAAAGAIVEAAAAEKFYQAALKGTDEQLILQAAAARGSALAIQELALAEFEGAAAAKAQTAANQSLAASELQVAKGAGVAAVSQLGLRQGIIATSGPFLAGAVAAAALVKSLTAFAQLETELNTFQVVAGATADQMERVGDEARQLGADITLPATSAADAATAMTELAKAGLSVEDSLQAARGVLQLSAAGQIDVAEAAKVTANALNAFGLEGEQATHVADLLAGASIAAQGEVSDMAQSLQQSAAVANQFGLSVDETAGAIALLAKNGILGSDAGTSLRTTLIRLIPTTKESQKLVHDLGIAYSDVSGRILPLSDIFENYKQALARLTPVQRQATLAQIFGTDAIRAATIFSREGAIGIREMTDEVDRVDAANTVASARTKGLAGEVAALGSSAETAGANIGEFLAPPLEELIGVVAGGLGLFNSFADILRELGKIEVGPFDFGELPKLITEGILFKPERVVIGAAIKGAVDAFHATNVDLKGEVEEFKRQSQALDAVARDSAGVREARDAFFQTFGDQPIFQSGLADAGERAGIQFVKGIGDGIASAEDEAVRKAEVALQKIIAEGNKNITQAVEDAKANLFSLGDTLSNQIGQLVDAGPLGTQIKGLEDALAASQTRDQRQGLVNDLNEARKAMKEAQIEFGPLGRKLEALKEQLAGLQSRGQRRSLAADLRTAQQELRDAEGSVQLAAGQVLDAEGRRSVTEFLQPFKDRVAEVNQSIRETKLQDQIDALTDKIEDQKKRLQGDPFVQFRQGITKAEQAIKNFNTEQLIASLQKQAAAEKTAVTRGIQDVIAEFNKGGISMAQANGRIAALIGKSVGPWQTAGEKLGTAFNVKFLATVSGIQEQLEAIVLGPQRPGTTGANARVSKPRDTVLAQAEARQAARDRIQEAINAKNDKIAANTSAIATNTAQIAANTSRGTGKSQTPIGNK